MKSNRSYSNALFDLLVLAGIEIFMMAYLDVRYLFLDTVVTGGDTASWQGIADHLMTVLLPQGRLTGWDMGTFCGYPNFSFYFLPPFLLAALTSTLFPVPLTITLKCVIVLGIFLLPVMTYFGLRAMDYRFPVPAIGASASLLFLFNESYTMFGGNILSTLTGEFCYMIAFALFAYFIGSLYRGVGDGSGVIKNGILLGLIGLTHLFVFIPAVCLLIYGFLAKGKLPYLFRVSLIAFGLMAFWILPLIAHRDPFTTPVYMIWQAFVNWRYAFMGLGLGLIFLGPRLAMAAHGSPSAWGLPLICFSGLGVFTLSYLGMSFLALGQGYWDTGLEMTPPSASPLGQPFGSVLAAWAAPLGLCLSGVISAIGFRAWQNPHRFLAFCGHTGAVAFLAVVILFALGLYSQIVHSLPSGSMRPFLLEGTSFALLGAFIAGGCLLFYSRIRALVIHDSLQTEPHRFGMFLALAFGCVTGYFSAHFLQIPDIRFLPPLIFALALVLFAETLEPLLAGARRPAAVFSSVLIFCGCMVSVIFGTTRADTWFRFNNMGYESMPGYAEFRSLNDSLRQVDRTRFTGPLNAPRVGYEKSDLYGRYGGDRVFESLPFFSGRQTLEGIHYASSFASKPMAFLQTAFSRDIKTPVPYILSRMNPDGLPAYFDLYNISQLILVSDEAKKAIQGSSVFEKEADFGPLSLYRYKDCQSLYVDLPKVRPVLYAGKNWVGDFFHWYKAADRLDVLMVPEAYVKSRLDRDVLSVTISSLMELDSLKPVPLQREGLDVHTSLEPMGIHFTTNRIGVPHLVKVSYFPNWKVQGAEGVYPVSPHLMLVIPREKEVVLTYGRSLWDHVGMVITVGTLMLLVLMTVQPVKRRFFKQGLNPPFIPSLEKGGNKIRPTLVVLVLSAAAGLIVAGAILRNKPVRTYVNGYKHYQLGNQLLEAKKVEEATRSFRKAIAAMAPIVETRHLYDHQDVIHCLLFTAMSSERLGDTSKAETLYTTILQEYPYSRYTGECYVKIARGKKAGRDPSLEQALSAVQRGNQAQALPSLKKAIDQTERHLAFLKRALVEDPYSVWAKYAAQDLEAERSYLKQKLPVLRGLCTDPELRQILSSVCSENPFGLQ